MKLSMPSGHIVMKPLVSFHQALTKDGSLELIEWIKDNIQGDYEILILDSVRQFSKSAIMDDEQGIEENAVGLFVFAELRDATMFKVAWG
jgi:hypothetical protein